ncbi:hypothetical protein ZWY2020_010676 [Hordeum vulgare]|nr:hypothetical protein ZWY2020_010676 [Hordeum vulgare]
MGFGLCRSKMMNGIVALHSPPMQKDAAEKNGALLRSAGCVGCHIRSSLFTRSFKHFVCGAPALLLRSNRSLLMLLRRHFFNGKKDTTTSPLCWTTEHDGLDCDQNQFKFGGWWFRDPVENASFMPRVLATSRIHSVILPLLHSWTSLLNIFDSSISATDDTRGRFLWRFFLLITHISMTLFYQMKQEASVRRTYKKEMVVVRSTLVHLHHSPRAQPRAVMLCYGRI